MNLEVKNKRAVKIIVIGLAVLAVLIILGLGAKKKEKVLTQEEIIQKQLEELDRLHKQYGREYTKEEIQNQLEEMDKLRGQAGAKSLSQETIQKQLEEMDKLRQSSQ